MTAQQTRNSTTTVFIVVLVLLALLGTGLFFIFNKPSAPPAAPVATEKPVETPVAVEPVAPTPKLLGVHSVVPKDTLWWISDHWYKDPILWPSIYEINRAQIQDPDRIFPGQKFDIPALIGSKEKLSPEDSTLLAQGYLEAYRVYKEKGKTDAEDYKRAADRLTPRP